MKSLMAIVLIEYQKTGKALVWTIFRMSSLSLPMNYRRKENNEFMFLHCLSTVAVVYVFSQKAFSFTRVQLAMFR